MFWAIRLLIQILYLLTNTEIKNLTLFETVKYLLITGCDTWVVVLGMTSIISYFCNNIAAFFRWVKWLKHWNWVKNFRCFYQFIYLGAPD